MGAEKAKPLYFIIYIIYNKIYHVYTDSKVHENHSILLYFIIYNIYKRIYHVYTNNRLENQPEFNQ